MKDENIFTKYLKLCLDTVFSIPLPKFRFVDLTTSSINSELTNEKSCVLIHSMRAKVFVHAETVPHGRNMHTTYVISTEDNFKRFNISNHRLNLK